MTRARCWARGWSARVRELEPALGLGLSRPRRGAGGVSPFRPDARPVGAQALEVEIRAEPRGGKGARPRAIGRAEGAPRLLRRAPTVAAELPGFAPRRRSSTAARRAGMADAAPRPRRWRASTRCRAAANRHRADAGADRRRRRPRRAQGRRRQARRPARPIWRPWPTAARLLRLKGAGRTGGHRPGRPRPRRRRPCWPRRAAAFAPGQSRRLDRPGRPFRHAGAVACPAARRPLAEMLCARGRRARATATLAQRLVRGHRARGRGRSRRAARRPPARPSRRRPPRRSPSRWPRRSAPASRSRRRRRRARERLEVGAA